MNLSILDNDINNVTDLIMAELLTNNQLLGMGNPLLDISATVNSDLLTKHNLKANDAILTEDEQIFQDLLADYKVNTKTFIFPNKFNNNLFQCQCLTGYEGKNCDADIDECKTSPCKAI